MVHEELVAVDRLPEERLDSGKVVPGTECSSARCRNLQQPDRLRIPG